MTLNRRRFLCISGAALAAGAARAETVWRGAALGAAAKIRLVGDADAPGALAAARDALEQVEQAFSLYRARSELLVLNREGRLKMSPTFGALLARADALHHATDGLFDPSIGSLWAGMIGARTGPVGWHHLSGAGRVLRLPRGMQLTFNGIAQGFATDRVTAALRAHGFVDVVVDMGEIWVGPQGGGVGAAIGAQGQRRITLKDRAVATSDVGALRVGGQSHILHPGGADAAWAKATVVARDATTADALSTALVLSKGTALADRLIAQDLAERIWLTSHGGAVSKLRG